MAYINFGEKHIDIKNDLEVAEAFNTGYVLTRIGKGRMNRVRSLRVNIKEFNLSSENRRILRKFSDTISISLIPISEIDYRLLKLVKDFYETKFGKGIFSSQKAKKLLTSEDNFNSLIKYSQGITDNFDEINGFVISYISSITKIIHYAYPFYKLELINTSFGMYMMTKLVEYAKLNNFKYVYLGSVHNKEALYKLQFLGLEWWDEKNNLWSNDLKELKERI